MASITSMGIGSGLDVSSLVTQLVASEKQPVQNKIIQQEATLQAQISAMGTVKGALSSFSSALSNLASPSTFQARTATSGNSSLFMASADPTAVAGSHVVEVGKLAQAQTVATNGFPDTTSAVGTGVLTFQFGTYNSGANTFTANAAKATGTVTIGASNNSLQGIRDAINTAHVGVNASIVNDGSGNGGNRLVLASADSGVANSIKLTVQDGLGSPLTGTTGLGALAYDPTAGTGTGKNMSQTIIAQDAAFNIDGIAMTRSSNTVTGAIEGVALSLVSASPGNPTSLSVSPNQSGVTGAVNKFVSTYNNLVNTLSSLTSYDTTTKKAGVLLGDATTNLIASRVRSVLGQAVSNATGPYASLADIGITTQKDGSLTVNNSKLQSALNANFNSVGQIFATAGQPSDSLVKFASSTSDTQAGQYAINVSRIASQGNYTGGASNSLLVDSTNNAFSVKVDGIQSGIISLTQKAYGSSSELATELQSRINGDAALQSMGMSVGVSYDSGKFVITSNRYGSNSQVGITSLGNSTNVFKGNVMADTLTGSKNLFVNGVDLGAINTKAGPNLISGTGPVTDTSTTGGNLVINGNTIAVAGLTTGSSFDAIANATTFAGAINNDAVMQTAGITATDNGAGQLTLTAADGSAVDVTGDFTNTHLGMASLSHAATFSASTAATNVAAAISGSGALSAMGITASVNASNGVDITSANGTMIDLTGSTFSAAQLGRNGLTHDLLGLSVAAGARGMD
ncbi:MAG: flagellar filament capping protein FliD, partial [Pseudomonadota bacterium]